MDAQRWVEEQVESAVRTGEHVRARVEALVASATRQGMEAGRGSAEVVRAALRGARAGLRATAPGQREALLMQVVDGVLDGVGTAAHAAELTLREARGDLARFAREDLRFLARSLQDLGSQFADLVAEAVADGSLLAAEETVRIRDHVQTTWRVVAPRVAAVVAAASAEPTTTVREATGTARSAARGAASALFTELGKRLHGLGVSLAGPRAKG